MCHIITVSSCPLSTPTLVSRQQTHQCDHLLMQLSRGDTYLHTGHEQLGDVGHSTGQQSVVGEGHLGSGRGLHPVRRHEREDPGTPQAQGDGGELSVEGRDALQGPVGQTDCQVVLVTLPCHGQSCQLAQLLPAQLGTVLQAHQGAGEPIEPVRLEREEVGSVVLVVHGLLHSPVVSVCITDDVQYC